MRVLSFAWAFVLIVVLPCAAWPEGATQSVPPGMGCADASDSAAPSQTPHKEKVNA